MISLFTLQFGSYTFPNQTFEIKEFPVEIDTPVQSIRRRDGGVVLQGKLTPRRWKINGRIFSEDRGTVYGSLNIMSKACHNNGLSAKLVYRSGWQTDARLAAGGISARPAKGLYEHLLDVEVLLISDNSCVESTTLTTTTGSRTNNSAVETINNGGNCDAGIFLEIVAGTWPFSNDIFIRNNGNSHFFQFQGPIAAGQTLIFDSVLGCVLLHVNNAFVDAISYFAGDLDFRLVPGNNDLVIDAASLGYTIKHRDAQYF